MCVNEHGFCEMVSLLLEMGAQVDLQTTNWTSALMSSSSQEVVAKILLESGAKIKPTLKVHLGIIVHLLTFLLTTLTFTDITLLYHIILLTTSTDITSTDITYCTTLSYHPT